jgi:hypothetical protein
MEKTARAFKFHRYIGLMVKNKLDSLFSYRKSKYPAHLYCTINISELLPTTAKRETFESRFERFLGSDSDNRSIYQLKDGRLIYRTEQLIPAKTDERPPLLLIFGNPATHSIKNGMFFSSKNDGKENRFWKHLLRPAGVLQLVLAENLTSRERNTRRLKRMRELDYDSPFRVGLCVYWSMPSSAGGPWSGVAAIRKLLGKKAVQKLEPFERERVLQCARQFLKPGGTAATFQRDAWNGLRSSIDPTYSIQLARQGNLRGTLQNLPHISLLGIPPTRLLGPARIVLRQLLTEEGYKLP